MTSAQVIKAFIQLVVVWHVSTLSTAVVYDPGVYLHVFVLF